MQNERNSLRLIQKHLVVLVMVQTERHHKYVVPETQMTKSGTVQGKRGPGKAQLDTYEDVQCVVLSYPRPPPASSTSILHQSPPPASSTSVLHQRPPPESSTSVLHQRPPPESSTSVLHQRPPPESSTRVLHQRPPPASSTSVLHQGPPPTSSTRVLHQDPPPASSTSVLHQRPPPGSSTNVLHQGAPPGSSTSVLHQRPPPASSTSVLHQRPPPASSTSVLHQRPPPASSTSILYFPVSISLCCPQALLRPSGHGLSPADVVRNLWTSHIISSHSADQAEAILQYSVSQPPSSDCSQDEQPEMDQLEMNGLRWTSQRNADLQAGKMAQWVRCLCKPEDLSSDPQSPSQNRGHPTRLTPLENSNLPASCQLTYCGKRQDNVSCSTWVSVGGEGKRKSGKDQTGAMSLFSQVKTRQGHVPLQSGKDQTGPDRAMSLFSQ
ncbi:hypothetical protein STEG23_007892, partial [Scotinomys teguina]